MEGWKWGLVDQVTMTMASQFDDVIRPMTSQNYIANIHITDKSFGEYS